MKECVKCKEEKILSEFDKRGNGLRGTCKDCRKTYVNNHYSSNRDYYKKKARKKDEVTNEKYVAYKEKLNCTDCGLSFKGQSFLCDFHHLDSVSKDISPSKAIKYSFNKLLLEIKKCIPLCANCHRTRHHKKGL